MDNVLNLSAFGEVIPGKKKEDITFKSFMEEPKKEEMPESPAKDQKDPASFVAM